MPSPDESWPQRTDGCINVGLASREKGSKEWDLDFLIKYDKTTNRLSYRDGKTRFFVKSDMPSNPDEEGLQISSRWPHITFSKTPPSNDVLESNLEVLMQVSPDIIRRSNSLHRRTRRAVHRLGSRILGAPQRRR